MVQNQVSEGRPFQQIVLEQLGTPVKKININPNLTYTKIKVDHKFKCKM